MKRVIVLSFILCCSGSVFSQDLIREIQILTLENNSLQKQVIKLLQDSIIGLNFANHLDMSKFQEAINTLENDKSDLNNRIKELEKDIEDLDKIKVQKDRDSLNARIEQLAANMVELKQEIQEKDNLIIEEKRMGEQKVNLEKEATKNEILDIVFNHYKSQNFDDLIRASTIQSIQRDRQLVANDTELEQVLLDLERYFNAKEYLTRKYESANNMNVQIELNQIKQPSILLDNLKRDIDKYKEFSEELKIVIEKIVDIDKSFIAGREMGIHKAKYEKIVSELIYYMYDYSNYVHYPYLEYIVLEVIKRKQTNSDADITDLLRKLE